MAAERRVRGVISTTSGVRDNPAWRLRDYLGGSGNDEGNGVAFDLYGSTYVAGSTKSQNFPLPPLAISTPFQSTLIGTQNAFVSRIGAVSSLLVQTATAAHNPARRLRLEYRRRLLSTSPTLGPTPPPTSFFTVPWRRRTAICFPSHGQSRHRLGSCNPEEGTLSMLHFDTAGGFGASVEIDMTADISAGLQQMSVSGAASANNGALYSGPHRRKCRLTLTWPPRSDPDGYRRGRGYDPGQLLSHSASLQYGGYSGTITPTQTTSPSIVPQPLPHSLPLPSRSMGRNAEHHAESRNR